jgi:hypothetical protein
MMGRIWGSSRAFVAGMTKGCNSLVGCGEEGRGDTAWGERVLYIWDCQSVISWGCLSLGLHSCTIRGMSSAMRTAHSPPLECSCRQMSNRVRVVLLKQKRGETNSCLACDRFCGQVYMSIVSPPPLPKLKFCCCCCGAPKPKVPSWPTVGPATPVSCPVSSSSSEKYFSMMLYAFI